MATTIASKGGPKPGRASTNATVPLPLSKPSDLSEREETLWDDVVSSVPFGMLVDGDRQALRRYVQLLIQWSEAHHELTRAKRVYGHKGELKLTAQFLAVEKLQTMLTKAESSLGLVQTAVTRVRTASKVKRAPSESQIKLLDEFRKD